MATNGMILLKSNYFFSMSEVFSNSSVDYLNWNDNDSSCQDDNDLNRGTNFEAVFIPALYSLAIVVGLPGNGLLLWVLAQQRLDWSVTDTFILHLGIADGLLLLTLPFWAAEAAQEHGWSFGTPLCKLTGAIFTMNFYCGIFLLACISVDRYMSIIHATQMYTRRKPWIIQTTCLAIWFMSLLLTIPDWIFLEDLEDARQNKTFCIHFYEHYSESAIEWRLASRLIYHTVGFILPAAIMLYCYSCILTRLMHGSQGLQKQKAMKIILVLVVVFFLCWTPYNIALILDTVYFNQTSPNQSEIDASLNKALKVTSSLGYLHSSLNPVLYAFVGIKFRRQLLNLFCSLGCRVKTGIRWQMPSKSRRSSIWSESGDTSNSIAI